MSARGRRNGGSRRAVVPFASSAPPTTSTSSSSTSSTTTSTTTTSNLLFSRRDLLSTLAAVSAVVSAAVAVPAKPASAQIAQRNTFTIDSLPPFDIDVPSSWTFSDTEAPGAVGVGRPTRVWFPRDDPLAPADVNVSLVVTLVGADFTSLGSFGDAEAFGSSLVSSMDRSFAGGPSARLVNAKKVSLKPRQRKSDDDGGDEAINRSRFEDKPREAYEIEYAVRRSKDDAGERLFVSCVALSFDGRYNRLYTLTGQTAAGEAAEKHGKEVEAIVRSFVPPATRV